MLFLSDQLLLLCSFLSTLVCAAPSQGRFTASFATSTGISPVQDFLVYSSPQQPLTVSGSCPSGYTNCISFGNGGACCPPNAICSLDGAGQVVRLYWSRRRPFLYPNYACQNHHRHEDHHHRQAMQLYCELPSPGPKDSCGLLNWFPNPPTFARWRL
jgi:hypothetical protein